MEAGSMMGRSALCAAGRRSGSLRAVLAAGALAAALLSQPHGRASAQATDVYELNLVPTLSQDCSTETGAAIYRGLRTTCVYQPPFGWCNTQSLWRHGWQVNLEAHYRCVDCACSGCPSGQLNWALGMATVRPDGSVLDMPGRIDVLSNDGVGLVEDCTAGFSRYRIVYEVYRQFTQFFDCDGDGAGELHTFKRFDFPDCSTDESRQVQVTVIAATGGESPGLGFFDPGGKSPSTCQFDPLPGCVQADIFMQPQPGTMNRPWLVSNGGWQ